MFQATTWSESELFELFDLRLIDEEGFDGWLRATLARCTAWFRATGASIFLAGEDGVYRLRAKAGAQGQVPDDAVFRPGEGIAGAVLVDGKPLIIGDPARQPVLRQVPVARRKEIASSMVVPLLGPGGEPLGVLNLSRGPGDSPFAPQDLEQAATLGRHVAMAASNARLVAQTRQALDEQNRKAEELEAVLDCVAGQVAVFDGEGRFDAEPGFHPVPLAAGQGLAVEVARTGQARACEAHADEEGRTWLIHAAPLSQGGGVLTVQEVTSFQQAQAEAGRLRRLAELGQMAAAIAHEIRNPLTGIRGAAQMLVGDPETDRACADIIASEALRLERLTEDFLTLARPMKLRRAPAALAEPVARVAELLRPQFAEKGVRLTLSARADDPMISLDVRRVEQVVQNLVLNALQACRPGGTVAIAVEGPTLTVADDGEGMSPATLERLFTPFFTTKATGTGLGLSNVRRIVEAHGGAIDVKSRLGQGTTFTATFGGLA